MATETTPIPPAKPQQLMAWLRCSVSPGQFPDEYAVGGDTFDGRPFSLFAPNEHVRPPAGVERGEGTLRVKVLDRRDGLVLVKLPDESFEGATSYITVRADQLVG